MPSREDRAPMMQRDRRAPARAKGGGRSRFRSARRRRSARSASRSRWPSSSIRCRRPTSSSTRPRPAARRPASSPAAGCSVCRRASSASAPTTRRRRCSRRSRAIVSGIADLLRHRSGDAVARHRDRGRRSLRRRRLRHPDRRVARGDRARARGPRRSFSIPPTPRRRWPVSSRTSASRSSRRTRRCCSGTPAARSGCSRNRRDGIGELANWRG